MHDCGGTHRRLDLQMNVAAMVFDLPNVQRQFYGMFNRSKAVISSRKFR